MTPELLQSLLVSEQYFEVGDKLLHFNTWETDKATIAQLLCRDMGIVSTVLLSICLKPHKVYKSHTIETYVNSDFVDMATTAMFAHLRKCRRPNVG